MEDITGSCEGVVKLLKNIKRHKVAGANDIHLMLLKDTAEEIAVVITAFSSFFISGEHSFDMTYGTCCTNFYGWF